MKQKATTNAQTERRKQKRFRVKEGALAFLGNVPGTIIDISEGGMAINYVVFEKEPDQQFRLDIFFGAENFYLPDIQSELVNDVRSEPGSPLSVVRVKRFGLRFRELNEEQKSRLQDFIHHNTAGEA